MFSDINRTEAKQILCCDPDPNSRYRATEQFSALGYVVLSTGNPQIASALVQEKPFAAVVIVIQKINLAMIAVAVDARRSKPNLPILVILTETGRSTIPAGLADIVLVTPSERAIRESLQALTEPRQLATIAS